MHFEPSIYGPDAVSLLAMDGDGMRLMPLVCEPGPGAIGNDAFGNAIRACSGLFADAKHPKGALAGLWTYFSIFDEAHSVAQDDSSLEGSFWHAILHRREPDAGNAGYWFRRVKTHPVFEPLAAAAREIVDRNPGCGFRVGTAWDPHAFIEYCESARSDPAGSARETAMEIQLAEWQLLFHHCAAPKGI